MQYESNWLAHHGVKGQKWGVQNGPPYPLSSNVSTGKELKKIAKVANKHFKSNTIYDFAKKQNKKAIADIKKQGNVQNRVNSDQDMYNDLKDHLEDTDYRLNSMIDEAKNSKEYGEWLKKPEYHDALSKIFGEPFEETYLDDTELVEQYLIEQYLIETNKEYGKILQERREVSNKKFEVINNICDDICGQHMYEKIGDFRYQSANYVNNGKEPVKGMTRATNAAVTQLLEENYQKKLDDYWYEEFDFSNNQWIRKGNLPAVEKEFKEAEKKAIEVFYDYSPAKTKKKK